MAKKSSGFGVVSGEPSGVTFTDKPGSFAGDKQTKRKAEFGVVREASGPTITCNDPAINFPSSEPAPKESKVIAESGRGTYKPSSKTGNNDFGGSVAVRGTMKSGKSDRKAHSF